VFPFHFPVSCRFVKVIQQLLISSSSSSRHFYLSFIFTSIMCFRGRLIGKVRPIQVLFLLFIVPRTFLSSLTQCNTSSCNGRWVQLISIHLQHHILEFPGISDLLSAVFKCQHLTKLCSIRSILLIYSLNLSPICW
jgi:hypothetical protein